MTVGLVNTYIVGRLGAEALATVGLSTQVSALVQGIFSAVGVGSTALIARHTGSGEHDEARKIGGQSLLLAVFVGVLAALPCLLWSGPIFTALGGDANVISLGRRYLFAVGTTLPLMSLLFVGSAVLRGAGDTRTPMNVMAIVNLVNVAVSWSLVNGAGPLPELGLLGAGIGAAAGVGLGGVLITARLLRGKGNTGMKIRPGDLQWDPQRSRRLFHIGLPSGGEQLLMRLGQLLMATAVTRLGTTAYAGHQLGIQVLSIAFMPGFAFSVAATTLVGQELGRNAPHRAESYVKITSWITLGVMCSLGLLALLFADPLLGLFTVDAGVIDQGKYALQGAVAIQLPLALNFVLAGALRGAGDTRHVLIAQALPIWLVRMPLAFFLGLTLGMGLTGIWAAMVIDMVCRAFLLGRRFRSGAWKWLRV